MLFIGGLSGLYGTLAVKPTNNPHSGVVNKASCHGSVKRVWKNMKIRKTVVNIHTNMDTLTKEEMVIEASKSKKNTRVKLLNCIHESLQEGEAMDTAYGYNPLNDLSFTGEFEAIGS